MRDRRGERSVDKRQKSFDRILSWLYILFILFAVALIIHLFFIQVIDIKKYRVKAKNQRAGQNFAVRGDIYDRTGLKLATDKVFYNVFARRADYDEDESSPEVIAKKLAPILKMSKEELLKKLNSQNQIIAVKKDIDRNTAKEIAKLHLRAISLDKKNTREYPQGTLAAHVLGYYNFDADIANGVEYTEKDKLEHVENEVKFQRTQKGKIIYDFMTDPVATATNPKGQDVTLTIDAAIQHICEKELEKMVKEKEALRGTVLVMNPKNGEILAYAVYPNYDPNNFRNASPDLIKNWTLTDVFPPGSTFKIITVASAMELGKINEHSTVLDTGKTTIGKWEIKNYDYDVHPYPGNISLEYLFEHSSNIGAINIAKTMTAKEFYDMLKKFGYGAKTGIDLPGESSGLLPYYTSWDQGIHATMSYGYGTSVTAMQMISAVQALANNGVKVTPHVIKYSPEEEELKIQRVQVVSPETARSITRLLAASVNNGRSAIKMDKYNVAAKTGTSRKPKENSSGYTPFTYTSTIGYLPASDPQILVYVMVDSAKVGAIWGNTVAGPVFHEVTTQIARIMNLKPDKISAPKKNN
ncbi:TPA: penicillin-binding protein 2 [Candidatus Scatousia excrementigallinarum]|mgnify:FL=1|uniref:Penicillin-binding protein 2 n=1 Tax=Candidatus Scatousia excrementigallinarum TaxID=2840935 RepID=A0A9D1JMI8_9BACT|nr:penicillin-binding protein 2 [Candidatus Scatousia excrementigallinarum]